MVDERNYPSLVLLSGELHIQVWNLYLRLRLGLRVLQALKDSLNLRNWVEWLGAQFNYNKWN